MSSQEIEGWIWVSLFVGLPLVLWLMQWVHNRVVPLDNAPDDASLCDDSAGTGNPDRDVRSNPFFK